ncbi:MAG: gliding motility lipoprotein GldB [Bacteroidota bacterium]
MLNKIVFLKFLYTKNVCKRFSLIPLYLNILLTGLLFSCSPGRLDIDVSDIDVEIQIKRFEKDLFELNPDSVLARISFFEKKYGLFYELFNTRIINIGGVDHPSYGYNLKNFITDPDMRSVNEECINQYNDLENLSDDLSQAFKHYRYYFPEKPVPEIITFISGFNYSIITADSILGIGLDMYLGQGYKFYSMLQLPKYKTQNMNKEKIVTDCMRGWAMSEFEEGDPLSAGVQSPPSWQTEQKDLLSQMIYQGKILYFVDAMLPLVVDSLKIGYTSQQIKWCGNNESNIWTFFIDKKLLYSTDHTENIKYIGEGPFTQSFPDGSPARIGQWMGWQIIRAYMENNPDVSLKELMYNYNAQKILTKSKYKPPR